MVCFLCFVFSFGGLDEGVPFTFNVGEGVGGRGRGMHDTEQMILKVDGKEKRGGQEGDSNSDSVWHCGDRGLFKV